jgi:hypothetical protein
MGGDGVARKSSVAWRRSMRLKRHGLHLFILSYPAMTFVGHPVDHWLSISFIFI